MKLIYFVGEVVLDWIHEMIWYLKRVIYPALSLLEWFIPLLTLVLCKYLGVVNTLITMFVIMVVIRLIKRLANKYNVGDSIPVPRERFTSEDEDGEVTIENNRLQELILYINDIENWLSRKGML